MTDGISNRLTNLSKCIPKVLSPARDIYVLRENLKVILDIFL